MAARIVPHRPRLALAGAIELLFIADRFGAHRMQGAHAGQLSTDRRPWLAQALG